MFENWYLLYDGQSTYGSRGHAKYLTITTDKQITEMHRCKIITPNIAMSTLLY